jgi:hypothetical protein
MFGMKTLFAMLSAVTRDMAFGAAKTVRANRRPTGAELRDPQNPFQAARLQAAKDKRQRKADKRYRDARYSGGQNYYAYAANILNVNK